MQQIYNNLITESKFIHNYFYKNMLFIMNKNKAQHPPGLNCLFINAFTLQLCSLCHLPVTR